MAIGVRDNNYECNRNRYNLQKIVRSQRSNLHVCLIIISSIIDLEKFKRKVYLYCERIKLKNHEHKCLNETPFHRDVGLYLYATKHQVSMFSRSRATHSTDNAILTTIDNGASLYHIRKRNRKSGLPFIC